MEFIDRIQEIQRLDNLAKNEKGGLAVVWGRRRVGKTRLLLEWVQKHKGIYFTADESSPPVQRKYLSLALEPAIPGFSEIDYPDWNTLFIRLAKEASQLKWKGPLIIDELPYLLPASPELPSILQRFIDHEAKKANLIIALCGSSQRMMQGAILHPQAPLYGRASEIIKLNPISVGFMGEALNMDDSKEIIESFAIWGGIPRYWELIENSRKKGIECIDSLVLDSMGPLNDEPNRLLLEETPSAISLRPVLDAIGLGSHRLSDIAAKLGQPATSLARPLQRLKDLDLIEREVPYGQLEQSSKKALYKIKDPFVRFWFEAVAPKRSFLTTTSKPVRIKWLEKRLPSLYAITWENLCRMAIPLLHNYLDDIIYLPAGRYWHGQEPEWDILSESLDGQYFLIGEAKWNHKAPTLTSIQKTIEEMRKKGSPPVKRNPHSKIVFVLFISQKPKNLKLPSDVKVIDANELLEALRV